MEVTERSPKCRNDIDCKGKKKTKTNKVNGIGGKEGGAVFQYRYLVKSPPFQGKSVQDEGPRVNWGRLYRVRPSHTAVEGEPTPTRCQGSAAKLVSHLTCLKTRTKESDACTSQRALSPGPSSRGEKRP